MSKRSSIAIAALTAILFLLTGTFAWQQTINKTNEFIGTRGGVILHDDFDPNTGAKDIYIENPNGTELFIRIKLDEAMNLASNTWRPSANDWITHTYEKNAGDCEHSNVTEEFFHSYFSWTMGGKKYYMPSNGSKQVVQDTTEYNGSEEGVKLTPDAKIIKAADYLGMDETRTSCFYRMDL